MPRQSYAWCLMLVTSLLAGCAGTGSVPQYAANWDQLTIGMPRLKAQGLLGEPNQASYRKGVSTPYVPAASKLDPERQALLAGVGGGEPLWSERWQYGSFSLTDMPDLANGSDKAFIVWIDDWGRVMQFRRPIKGPFAAQTQPVATRP